MRTKWQRSLPVLFAIIFKPCMQQSYKLFSPKAGARVRGTNDTLRDEKTQQSNR